MSKKVKVRVAVAVGADGSWSAAGAVWDTDASAFSDAAAGLYMSDAINQYFLEAELDLPEPVTVQAEVV